METALAERHAATKAKKAAYTLPPEYAILGTGECYENMAPEEEAAMDADDYRRGMESLAEVEAGGRVYSLEEILEELRELEN